MRRVIITSLIVWLATPLMLLAQEQPDRAPTSLFERLDKNHDGSVAADEVPAGRERLFQRLLNTADRNDDGKLSRDEFAAGLDGDRPRRPEAEPDRAREGSASGEAERPRGGRPGTGRGGDPGLQGRGGRGPAGGLGGPGPAMMGGAAILRAIDVDSDGQLSADEIEGAIAALKKLDRNKDGQISRDELGGFPGRGPGGGFGGSAMLERLRQFDRNNNGKFEKDELPPRLQERFDAFDRNNSGSLDESELRAAAAQPLPGRTGRPGAPRTDAPGGRSSDDAGETRKAESSAEK